MEVVSDDAAREYGFYGSPSIHVDGIDLEHDGARQPSMTCRLYGDEGVPSQWLMEAGILRALKPKGLLFLCVANSARSQIGEGIARALAPVEVRVQSAGSAPTSVRPEAQTVLWELGIDTSAHRSKNVSEIDPSTVDTVITLCGEEECPLFLGNAYRLHWGLPDPAGVQGSQATRLAAFRWVRDELKKRLAIALEKTGD